MTDHKTINTKVLMINYTQSFHLSKSFQPSVMQIGLKFIGGSDSGAFKIPLS